MSDLMDHDYQVISRKVIENYHDVLRRSKVKLEKYLDIQEKQMFLISCD
jgi:hypothetical protein